MKTLRLVTGALYFGLATTSLCSLANANTDVPPHVEQQASAQVPVTRATLENGLRVVIIRNTLAPVVTTELNYLVGSNETDPAFPGTAHALEHMMFRGSEGLDKDQLASIGAQLGGSYNADTTENVTQYFYTAPAEDLDVMLRIEALRMKGLSLRPQDWEKERGAIEQEVSRDLSSPVYKYISQLQAIMFAGTPYEHDALGTRASFDKTDIVRLRKFYEHWYAPNNAILVIAGDIDPTATLKKVKNYFDAIPKKTLPERKTFSLSPLKAHEIALPTDLPIGLVGVAYRMPGMTSADYAAATLLSDILASQRGALYGLVPQGKALLSEFDYIPKGDVGFGVAIAGFPKGGNGHKVLDEVRHELDHIQKSGVSSELLEAARQKELAQLAFQANSISGQAEIWSQALAFQGLQSPDEMALSFKKVTLEDVNRLARTLLKPDQAVTAILTPENSGKPIAGKGYGGAESFASTPDKPVKLPQWAQKELASLNIPPAAPKPVDMKLSNGIRLIVQNITVSPTISVFGSIRQEPKLQEPRGKDGVATLTEGLFSYGTTKHDRLGFQKALDDIAAEEEAGTSFSLQVLKTHFEKGMELLAENELSPAFPEQALKIVRTQQAQSLAGMLQSPNYLFKQAIIKAVVPPYDPSLREPTPQQVMNLQRQDVEDFFHKNYRPDLTTIVIAGDITPANARAAVEKYFGNWHAEGPVPPTTLPPIPNSTASSAHVPDKSSVQDGVILTENINLLPTDPQHYIMNVGNEILGGGFSSRLYKDLRVKTGYVYNVNSHFNWGRTRTAYSISFGADPDKVSKARDAAINNLKTMQTHPVDPEELTLAKAALLRGIPLQRASVTELAETYLYLAGLNLPLDNSDRAARIYYRTTAQDIQAAFQKWLRPHDLSQIVKGPKP